MPLATDIFNCGEEEFDDFPHFTYIERRRVRADIRDLDGGVDGPGHERCVVVVRGLARRLPTATQLHHRSRS
ncbi:hypothetical protein [Actinoplanes sp. NPDC048796]|uniref:hypothetical protein n=1 Tax=Actinoplanes sp. NPDC048796 TaxID=3155640 RepID=UPI0033F9EA09